MLTDLLRELGLPLPLAATERPQVGISACLLGRPVRYDGGHRLNARARDELNTLLVLHEVCPEVGIGLPVPRPPIQVIRLHGELRVRGVAAPHHDVTKPLRDYADHLHEPLDGFILKARSPSCGLGNTPLHDPHGTPVGHTDGAFAARLRQRFPGLPLCDEEQLDDEQACAAFVMEVYQYRGRRRAQG